MNLYVLVCNFLVHFLFSTYFYFFTLILFMNVLFSVVLLKIYLLTYLWLCIRTFYIESEICRLITKPYSTVRLEWDVWFCDNVSVVK